MGRSPIGRQTSGAQRVGAATVRSHRSNLSRHSSAPRCHTFHPILGVSPSIFEDCDTMFDVYFRQHQPPRPGTHHWWLRMDSRKAIGTPPTSRGIQVPQQRRESASGRTHERLEGRLRAHSYIHIHTYITRTYMYTHTHPLTHAVARQWCGRRSRWGRV